VFGDRPNFRPTGPTLVSRTEEEPGKDPKRTKKTFETGLGLGGTWVGCSSWLVLAWVGRWEGGWGGGGGEGGGWARSG